MKRVAARILFIITRWLLRMPSPLAQRISGKPVHVDGATLDPGVQLMLALRRWMRTPANSSLTPAAARALARRESRVFGGSPEPVGDVADISIPGPAGAIRARHYRPLGGSHGKPLLLFFHGGGFVIGDIDTHDQPCRLLCRYADVHVVSVDYRLGPENKFPAPIDDAVAVLDWAREHVGEIGVDPSRIAVGGDSAGGNIAAVLCLQERGRTTSPAAQLLIYPTVDATKKRPSRESFAEGFFLTQANIDWYGRHDTRIGNGILADDPRVSPLRAPDLSNLPPAIVVTAGFDPLRDEGDEFAAALQAAGTRCVHLRMRSLVHGFINMTALNRTSRDAVIEMAGALRALLVTPRAGTTGSGPVAAHAATHKESSP